ncbi:hypothetical protein [Xanthomonas arboricola]|uniref:hypothetical protein n=1 Tax=Xanthomonas arboricola TaxID=56448 RepID=UPI0017B22784|nr:hypothetical protein [Xanthomonas arboricola]MBB3759256.1 hypothetical protein [Xanthomonas arboricola]
MSERPILFNAPMVRAILSGAKTQTRRVIAPQPSIDASGNFCWNGWNFGQDIYGLPLSKTLASQIPCSRTGRVHCPFGKIGDRLWVKETTVRVEEHGYVGPVYAASQEGQDVINWGLAPAPDDCTDIEPHEIKLRPSIHMPRSMCRLVLEITDVRVERCTRSARPMRWLRASRDMPTVTASTSRTGASMRQSR